MFVSSSTSRLASSRRVGRAIYTGMLSVQLLSQEAMPSFQPDASPGRVGVVSYVTSTIPGATLSLGDVFHYCG